MDPASRARAALARLTARRFGRPVPADDIEEELTSEGLARDEAHEAVRRLTEARYAHETPSGLISTSPPLASRAPLQAASAARLHR